MDAEIKKHFETLGVADNSSMEEVDSVFKEKLKEAHSDLGGDDEATRNLIEARDAIKENLMIEKKPNDREKQISIYKEKMLDIELSEKKDERKHEIAKREIEQTIKRVYTLRVSPLIKRRNTYVIYSSVAAIAGLIIGFAIEVFSGIKFETDPYQGEAKSFATLFIGFMTILPAIPFGLLTFLLNNRVQSIKSTIEILENTFSDISECAIFLGEVINAGFQQVVYWAKEEYFEPPLEEDAAYESYQEFLQNGFTKDQLISYVYQVIMHRKYDEEEKTKLQRIMRKSKSTIYDLTGAAHIELKNILETLGPEEIESILESRSIEHGLLEKRRQGTLVTFMLVDTDEQ
jgi:curved DNA-binding protein CbpA